MKKVESNYILNDEEYRKFKEDVKDNLDTQTAQVVDFMDEIGYDIEFVSRCINFFEKDMDKSCRFICLLFRLRQNFSNNHLERFSEDMVCSSIADNYAYFYKQNKRNSPTLVIKVANSRPGVQSVNERVTYIFYLFETGLALAKKAGLHQISIIYDRTDFDKEKHFDNRMPLALKKYHSPELGECFAEFLDTIYILNIGMVYRMMFEVYKVFAKKKIIQKIKLLADKEELSKYFDSDSIPKEYL